MNRRASSLIMADLTAGRKDTRGLELVLNLMARPTALHVQLQ
jgi:hypothetical protein